MKNDPFDIRTILSTAFIYNFFAQLIGTQKNYKYLIKNYIHPKPGDKILDMGCGVCAILEYLPTVKYLGIDISKKYIKNAKKNFGNRGQFLCREINSVSIKEFTGYDIVLSLGVLHHLNNEEAKHLFRCAHQALKTKGKLLTLDGCYVDKQSWIKKIILSKDRGKFVRTEKEYLDLTKDIFSKVNIEIKEDLSNIPYTYIIIECIK